MSGSIIVFEDELARVVRPDLFRPVPPNDRDLSEHLQAITTDVHRNFPEIQFTEIFFPIESEPALQFEGFHRTAEQKDELLNVYVDPATGQILGTTDRFFWLSRIRDLHVRLLSGRTGLIVNGYGAVLLLILALTGVVVWWPGSLRWRRGFRVDFRRKWSRINFELHSALGIWLFSFVLIWAVSAIYFVWPEAFVSLLDRFTPTRESVHPTVVASPSPNGLFPVETFMIKAEALKPGYRVLEVVLPSENHDPLVVVVAPNGSFRRATHLFFDPGTGSLLRTWQRGNAATFGGAILPWLADLHFGESWGWPIKTLWAVFGLVLPALAVTGAVMYWNRFLAKKWRRLARLNKFR